MNIYDASTVTFIRMLNNLSSFLDKAVAHAQAKKFSPDNFVMMRLAPDMLPLRNQVFIACDTAKFCVQRLTGVEAPKHEDTATTMAELKTRIASTIDFLKSVPASKFEGADTRPVTWKVRGEELTLPGAKYFLGHANPNFFFHTTTAYDLLRHGGVDIGKSDFLFGIKDL